MEIIIFIFGIWGVGMTLVILNASTSKKGKVKKKLQVNYSYEAKTFTCTNCGGTREFKVKDGLNVIYHKCYRCSYKPTDIRLFVLS